MDTAEQHLDALRRRILSADESVLLSLMGTVYNLITYGWDEALVRHDGTQASIIELSAQGHKFTCGTFQRLFSSMAQDAGFRVREVTLVRRGTELAEPANDPWLQYARHQVVSVNLQSRMPTSIVKRETRWAMFDPTNNLVYRRNDGMPMTVEAVLTAVWESRPVNSDYVLGQKPGIPTGPAYRPVEGVNSVVLDQGQINSIFNELRDKNFLPYANGYAVWREEDRVVAYCPDPTYRPTTHLGIPLNEMFGGDIHWED